MGNAGLELTKNWIMLLQLDLKHIHKVNFYPSHNDFTQALLVTNMISGHRHLCLQALQAKMCCNAYHDRFFKVCRFPTWEYERRLSAGWVSAVNNKTNQIFFFLSLALMCRFVFFYISFVSGRLPRLTDSFQAFWGCGEEARVVFCQHVMCPQQG